MEKKSIIIWSVVTLFTVIVALEVFGFHPGFNNPSFNIGRYQVRWSGQRYMRFKTLGSLEGANLINGRLEKFTVRVFGPVTVWTRHDRSVSYTAPKPTSS